MELGVGQPAIVEPLLVEHHLGVWQGLTLAEVDGPLSRVARGSCERRVELPDPGRRELFLDVRAGTAWLALDRGVPIRVAVTHELMSQTIQGAYAHLSPSETLAKSHPQTSVFRMSGGSIEGVASRCDARGRPPFDHTPGASRGSPGPLGLFVSLVIPCETWRVVPCATCETTDAR